MKLLFLDILDLDYLRLKISRIYKMLLSRQDNLNQNKCPMI